MAVGDGGFSTQMGGFNKNEVNEYISNLRKKMNELEAEMKDNDSKVKAAVRTADEAESKIQKLEKEKNEKISELELQIKTERKNAEDLLDKIDDLKRKVKNKVAGSASGASSAEAQKQAAEIIEKANKTARETVDVANKTAKLTVDDANKTAKKTVDEANKTAGEVVEKAKQTAREIIENAQSASAAGGASSVNLDGFMSELRGFFDKMNSEYKSIIAKAEEISSQGGAEPKAVDIPDFSGFEAPKADAPKEAEVRAAEAPEAEAPIFSEPVPNNDISFENIEQISSDEKDEPTAFDDDMMSAFGNLDEPVSEVKENDTSDHSKASFDMDFGKDLIAQTVPSSSLNAGDVDEDLLAAVRREEEKFAVQPTGGREDFDMNSMSMDDDNSAADDGAEAMRRMLAEAEAAFGGGSSLDYDTDNQQDDEPAPAESSANPWEDLQKQLEAMEQSGNFGESEPESAAEEPAAQPSAVEDPQVPTTDDSSIWDFSSDSSNSSDDDDMSADVFANF